MRNLLGRGRSAHTLTDVEGLARLREETASEVLEAAGRFYDAAGAELRGLRAGFDAAITERREAVDALAAAEGVIAQAEAEGETLPGLYTRAQLDGDREEVRRLRSRSKETTRRLRSAERERARLEEILAGTPGERELSAELKERAERIFDGAGNPDALFLSGRVAGFERERAASVAALCRSLAVEHTARGGVRSSLTMTGADLGGPRIAEEHRPYVDPPESAAAGGGLVAVRLLVSRSPYAVGEIAGFPGPEAHRLVEAGEAEMVTAEPIGLDRRAG